MMTDFIGIKKIIFVGIWLKAILLISLFPSTVHSWISPSPPTKTTSRAEHARILLKELQKGGKSTFRPGICVISEGGDECGIQMPVSTASAKTHVRAREEEKREVIFVHRDEFLTPQMGLETPIGQALQLYLSHPENSATIQSQTLPSVYLAIYLSMLQVGILNEKDTSRVVQSYFQTLPSISELQHLPVFWEANMLNELQCSLVKQEVQLRKDVWLAEFWTIQTALLELGISSSSPLLTMTEESWLWARSMITSRGFTDTTGHACLCPYVDMMNHISDAQASESTSVVKCTWEIDNEGWHLYLPKIKDDINNGFKDMTDNKPRLEISYGTHTNAQFLMNYGFFLAEGDDEEEVTCSLSLFLPEKTEDAETESLWEADGLGDCHMIARNITLEVGHAGPMESVLSLCRVASAKQSELKEMRKRFTERDEHSRWTDDGLVPQLGATLCRSPFSISNEIRALEMLQSSTQIALRKYSTTIAEDTRMLSLSIGSTEMASNGIITEARVPILQRLSSIFQRKSHPAHETAEDEMQWRNAVGLRCGEKKILNHYFILASIGLNFLHGSNEDDLHFDTYKGMLDASLHDRSTLLRE